MFKKLAIGAVLLGILFTSACDAGNTGNTEELCSCSGHNAGHVACCVGRVFSAF